MPIWVAVVLAALCAVAGWVVGVNQRPPVTSGRVAAFRPRQYDVRRYRPESGDEGGC